MRFGPPLTVALGDNSALTFDNNGKQASASGLSARVGSHVHSRDGLSEQQIILAAEISVEAADFGHLEPMLDTTLAHLRQHGITEQPEAVVGDAGYWHTRQIESIADRGIEVLVPPTARRETGSVPGGRTGSMNECATSSPAIAAAPSTRCGRPRSSRCSPRSNTTAESITSCEEAELRCSRSYGWWRRLTTCSSFTTTGSPTPPERTNPATARRATPPNRDSSNHSAARSRSGRDTRWSRDERQPVASPTRSHRTSSLIQQSTTTAKTCRPNRGRSRVARCRCTDPTGDTRRQCPNFVYAEALARRERRAASLSRRTADPERVQAPPPPGCRLSNEASVPRLPGRLVVHRPRPRGAERRSHIRGL